MSVYWRSERFGYDGDFFVGYIKVNYWQDREKVAAEVDRQYEAIRAAVLTEWPRLSGAEDPIIIDPLGDDTP